jgi:hypothetical protein
MVHRVDADYSWSANVPCNHWVWWHWQGYAYHDHVPQLNHVIQFHEQQSCVSKSDLDRIKE